MAERNLWIPSNTVTWNRGAGGSQQQEPGDAIEGQNGIDGGRYEAKLASELHAAGWGWLKEPLVESDDRLRLAIEAVVLHLGNFDGPNVLLFAQALASVGSGGFKLLSSLEENMADPSTVSEICAACLDALPSFARPVATKAFVPEENDPARLAQIKLSVAKEWAAASDEVVVRLARRPARGRPDRVDPAIHNNVWASSIVGLRLMSRDLGEFSEVFRHSSTVLEIGAGLGVTSLGLCLLLSATETADTRSTPSFCITDGNGDSVSQIEENIKLNGVERLARAAHLDWNAPSDAWPVQSAEVIIATDIIHERDGAFPILRVIKTVLKRTPEARAYLVNPAPRHRFGVEEFLKLVVQERELIHDVRRLDPDDLTDGLDGAILEFDLHTLRWRSP